MKAVLHFDGACEPRNPGGVATFGFILRTQGRGAGDVVVRGHGLAGEPYTPDATNNVGEYTALIRGLQAALERGVTHIEAVGDSQLVVRQLNGAYAVHSPRLLPLYEEARAHIQRFEQCLVRWVPRERNREADALSKEGYAEFLHAREGGRPPSGGTENARPQGPGAPPSPRVPSREGPTRDAEETLRQIRDLTMILLYLTRWTEDNPKELPPGTKVAWRAWKGHDWGALDRLQKEGRVAFSYKAKSLGLTVEGEKEARRLLRAYGLGEREESP